MLKLNNIARALVLSVLGCAVFCGGVAARTLDIGNTAPMMSLEQAETASIFAKTLTKRQAIQDIEYALSMVEKYHVSAVNGLPKEVLEQKAIEIKRLGKRVSVVDVWRALSRIFVKLHDAHSTVALKKKALRLPIEVEVRDDKFYCKSDGNYRDCEIVAINDREICDLYNEFVRHYSHEIEEWCHCNFFEIPGDYITDKMLILSGIDTSNPVKLSFATKNGIEEEYFNMSFVDDGEMTSNNWIFCRYDKGHDVAILTLNKCHLNERYIKTVVGFLQKISKEKINNIIIDLRLNKGGDSRVANAFAYALKNINKFKMFAVDERRGDRIIRKTPKPDSACEINAARKKYFGKYINKLELFGGNVYIATSHRTFSSARLFAEIFQDNGFAKIVGEAPGSSPEAYGNLVLKRNSSGKLVPNRFITPNSRLVVSTTFKKFYRIDSSKSKERIVPDVEVRSGDAIAKIYEIIENQNKK